MVISKQSSESWSRGQVYTVEAVAAAVLILSGVIFAQSITAVTPMTASTASQHAENQQGEIIKGFITAANEDKTLKKSLLYWDNANRHFHNARGSTNYYTVATPNSEFGNMIQSHFINKGLGVRVDLIYYANTDGEFKQIRQPYIDFGQPSNHAFTTTASVVLYDSDYLVNADGTKSSIQLKDNNSTYFIQDIKPNSEVYNIITVRVTIWRI